MPKKWIIGLIFGVCIASVYILAACADDNSSRYANFDPSKTEMALLFQHVEGLKEKDRALLGGKSSTWRPGFKRVLELKDPRAIIEYMGPVVESHPENLATFGAYERIALAFRDLKNEEEASIWLRKGIDAVDALVERHKDGIEMAYLVSNYRNLYGGLSNATSRELEEERQKYLSALSNPAIAKYKDSVMISMASMYFAQGSYAEVLDVCRQMREFYKSKPENEKDRLGYQGIEARALARMGREQEALDLLESRRKSFWGKMSETIEKLQQEIRDGKWSPNEAGKSAKISSDK